MFVQILSPLNILQMIKKRFGHVFKILGFILALPWFDGDQILLKEL